MFYFLHLSETGYHKRENVELGSLKYRCGLAVNCMRRAVVLVD